MKNMAIWQSYRPEGDISAYGRFGVSARSLGGLLLWDRISDTRGTSEVCRKTCITSDIVTLTRRYAATPTRLPLAELEDVSYAVGWLTNEFWRWLGT
jgi:hypothetical protein